MNSTGTDDENPSPPPIEDLMERYYKKKYFSMNIFKESLTKPFDWNKNYTKLAKI
jgi:hypothetical protein